MRSCGFGQVFILKAQIPEGETEAGGNADWGSSWKSCAGWLNVSQRKEIG